MGLTISKTRKLLRRISFITIFAIGGLAFAAALYFNYRDDISLADIFSERDMIIYWATMMFIGRFGWMVQMLKRNHLILYCLVFIALIVFLFIIDMQYRWVWYLAPVAFAEGLFSHYYRKKYSPSFGEDESAPAAYENDGENDEYEGSKTPG